MTAAPKVSIGLPVWNGERFLGEALDSILAQSFGNFELIVSDNASTDGTEAICRDYAARDGRIVYHRQAENIGAAGNYNFVFHRSRGRYFKWAAHDDMIAPLFLEACLARLEADPSVSVAFARMREITETGAVLRDYNASILWDGRTSASRLESLLCAPPDRTYIHRCVPITGLMRAEMLRKTRLIGRFGHADKVTLVELALLGDFAEVPDRLFLRRMHAGVSLAANRSPQALVRWFDPSKRAGFVAPRARLFREYVTAVLRAPIAASQKRTCVRPLLRMLRRDWRILGGEVKAALKSQLLALPPRATP